MPLTRTSRAESKTRLPQIVYVVEGQTGEYSDHIEWPIMAYTREEDAKFHVLEADKRAKELKVSETNLDHTYTTDKNQYDPNMQVDYTGVRYSYYPVELREEFTPC